MIILICFLIKKRTDLIYITFGILPGNLNLRTFQYVFLRDVDSPMLVFRMTMLCGKSEIQRQGHPALGATPLQS